MTTRTTDRAPVEPILDEELAAQLPTFELFFKTFGFKRVLGRIWGLLVLSGRPLASREISEQLGLSQGAASTALTELSEWGAITSEFDTSRRCHLHAPVSNTLSIVATVLRRREQVVFQQFKTAAARTLVYVSERYGEKDPRVMTLRSIISTCEIAESVMQLVVSAVANALDDSQSLLSKAINTALKVGVAVPHRLIGSRATGKDTGERTGVPELPRIVITGVGLTSPIGDSLTELRKGLLEGRSGVESFNVRHLGETPAGVCHFDALRHQKKKEVRRGTRAGSISIWCAQEALADSGLSATSGNGAAGIARYAPERTGIYVGITEHGNVETENQVMEVAEYAFDLSFWSHHHNPRTVANNPAGEVTLTLGATGPAYCLGGACAAGNLGLIQGVQQLQLGLVDLALAGGVSESIRSTGIFASFRAQGALARHDDPTRASRPFDRSRNGIVVSEGGCLYTLERLEDARARGARIYGEVVGYHVNSDGRDFVLPQSDGQAACMRGALAHAGIDASEVDLVNTHATSTPSGDVVECEAMRAVFTEPVLVNNTKSFIGHAMGAAGALELAGNLPSFEDGLVHPTINVEDLDPECALDTLVINEPTRPEKIDTILNMSFGMLGINSAVIVRRAPA